MSRAPPAARPSAAAARDQQIFVTNIKGDKLVKTRLFRPRRPSWRVGTALAFASAIVGGGIGLHTNGIVGAASHHRPDSIAVAANDMPADPNNANPPLVNPYWVSLHEMFSFPETPKQTADGDYQVATKAGTAASTGDDGIVLLRVFIPAQNAAGGMLNGDNRGFSADPSMPFRAEVAWDTLTGQVAVQVNHSTVGPNMPGLTDGNAQLNEPIPALPLQMTDPATAGTISGASTHDVVRSFNYVAVDKNAAPSSAHFVLSLLNPLTNQIAPFAWTVDQNATFARTSPGHYQLSLSGNGYPAVEAYYYPRMARDPLSPAAVIAKRSVEPSFVNNWLGHAEDHGGGEAAQDSRSWVTCTHDDTAHSFNCTNQQDAAPHEQWTTPDGASNTL